MDIATLTTSAQEHPSEENECWNLYPSAKIGLLSLEGHDPRYGQLIVTPSVRRGAPTSSRKCLILFDDKDALARYGPSREFWIPDALTPAERRDLALAFLNGAF